MTTYLRQGTLRFVPGYKLQTRWGPTEAAVFALECAGAPLLALGATSGAPLAASAIGWTMVVAAIVLLFVHLGHPRRAWLAVRNLRHSWISRGTVALGVLVLLGAVELGLRAAGVEPAPPVRATIDAGLVALAVFVGLYPGLVLSASPAIPFWSSGLLPVLSLAQGAASALAIALAVAGGAGAVHGVPLPGFAASAIAAVALLTAIYVGTMLRRGAAGAESARHLLRDRRGLFALAGCGLGLVVPAIAIGWGVAGGGDAAWWTAALARAAGDYATRRAFLEVGMFDPVI